MSTRAQSIERKLVDSLAKDRRKASRCVKQADGTITVNISGVSAGLLYALSCETGEADADILRRMDAAVPVMEGKS